MCGRFALNETPRKLAEHFDLTGDLDLSPSWNIAPSTRICSIAADGFDAARSDPALYELLTLVDAIRGGRARERTMAIKEFGKRLAKYA